MNRSILALVLASLAAAPAFAAEDHSAHAMHGMNSMAAPAASSAALSEGVVKKIDKAAGTVTLTHGPLKNLGMGPMTMSFAVADAAILGKLKVGDKVRFLAEDKDGALTASHIELAK